MSDRTAGNLTVDQVRTRFGQWRQDRQGKARIPDELWLAAMEVAAETASTEQQPNSISTAAN